MANNEESSTSKRGQYYKDYAYTPVSTRPVPSTPDTADTTKVQDTESIGDRINFTPPVCQSNRMAEESGSKIFQFIAAVAGNLCVVAGGAILGWTSPILLRLENATFIDDNPLGEVITEEEGSWIGSLTPVGALVGSFVAGYLAEKIGRKQTLLSSIIPFAISWVLIATATSVGMLYAARLVGGLAIAVAFTVIPMYCGEIAETSIRGILGSFLQLFITVGLLWSYCIGPYVSYNGFWIACAVLPVTFFIIFFFMPESPYYLSARGKHTEVVTVLARLRGKSIEAVKTEADEIQASVEEAFKNEATLADLYRIPSNFKALIFTSALVTFQQMTGINVVLFYSQTIFAAAGSSSIPSEVSTIIVGLVQLGASCVTPLVVDRLGRKILLIFSGIGETVSLIALGLFFYLQKQAEETGDDVSNIGWLPVASLMIFIATYSVGWGPLPWAVMGEMFATDVKSKASGITVFVCWTLAFIITKFFSNVVDAWGMHTAFWLFAVFCILSVLFTVFILPETKGKTLQQIQAELGGGAAVPPSYANGTDVQMEKNLP